MPDVLFHPKEEFHVVRCSNCGLGFVNPRPRFDEIGKYYPPEFFKSFVDTDHADRYLDQARFIEQYHPGTGRLLDIGCANGDFPRFMHARGWSVEGVEVSASAKPITDFRVFATEFSNIPVSEPTYDVISAWAVLEHVHDPISYFRKAFEILKPGGIFVFLVTNFDSLSSNGLFREDVPRHLYFFSQSTAKQYCEAVGLNLEVAQYGKQFFEMRPTNFLRYYLYRYIKRKPLTYKDLPEGYGSYLKSFGGTDGVISRIRYAMRNPLQIIDMLITPIVERVQIRKGSYGIVTFVARKSHG